MPFQQLAEVPDSTATKRFSSLQKVLLDNIWLNNSSLSLKCHTTRFWLHKIPSSFHFLFPSGVLNLAPQVFAPISPPDTPKPRGIGHQNGSMMEHSLSGTWTYWLTRRCLPVSVLARNGGNFKVSFKHTRPVNTRVTVRNNWRLRRMKILVSG